MVSARVAFIPMSQSASARQAADAGPVAELEAAVEADPATIAVGGADSAASADTVAVPGGNSVVLSATLADLLSKVEADVVVDFSNGAGAVDTMAAATNAGVRVVSGSTMSSS